MNRSHRLIQLKHASLRKEFRAFRLNRIKSFAKTKTSFRPRRVPLLRDFFARIEAKVTS